MRLKLLRLQVGEDPFSSQKADKAQRVKAQTKRQVTNLKAQAKAEGKQLPSLDASQDYAARKQKQAQQVCCPQCQPGVNVVHLHCCTVQQCLPGLQAFSS